MDKKTFRLGVSGGTFDPIHYGHLILAEGIREEFKLDKVLFIPAGTPPHKKDSRVTPAEDRYSMVSLAISSNACFQASRMEIEREGYTYTIDTLKHLQRIYGEGTEIFFIIGADVVFDLLTWRDFEEVFRMCRFVAAVRPGFAKERFLERITYLKTRYKAEIHVADIPLIDISSTRIRERLAAGQSVRYLVPEEVERYIKDNRLYTGVEICGSY
jgi:nicotinate-nucleotide adenylyltransferase